jgi:hypothetical protein
MSLQQQRQTLLRCWQSANDRASKAEADNTHLVIAIGQDKNMPCRRHRSRRLQALSATPLAKLVQSSLAPPSLIPASLPRNSVGCLRESESIR